MSEIVAVVAYVVLFVGACIGGICCSMVIWRAVLDAISGDRDE